MSSDVLADVLGEGEAAAPAAAPVVVVRKREREAEDSAAGGSGSGSAAGGSSSSSSSKAQRSSAASGPHQHVAAHAPEHALATARSLTEASELASLIQETLHEQGNEAVDHAVRVLGCAACAELLIATLETEAGDEPCMTADGKRRRTCGGVFFHLMKSVASKEQYKAVFQERDKGHNARMNARRREEGGRDRMKTDK
jgi:hypothetical protein